MTRPTRLAAGTCAALAALGLAYASAGQAGAEQSGRDGMVVSFNAQISPRTLPRTALAPVSISLSGGVRSEAGKPPPVLRKVEFAFGGRGSLSAGGLSTCPRLRNATSRQALDRCRAALVGRGSIITEVPLAADAPLLVQARALAFNARRAGSPEVLVHAYSASPPVSFVLPFRVRELRRGAYGLLFSAPVAHTLGRWPRLRSFRLTLGRRYRTHGAQRSYLTARCPLPPRLHSLTVPVARSTYRFDPAPTITTTINRACRTRD